MQRSWIRIFIFNLTIICCIFHIYLLYNQDGSCATSIKHNSPLDHCCCVFICVSTSWGKGWPYDNSINRYLYLTAAQYTSHIYIYTLYVYMFLYCDFWHLDVGNASVHKKSYRNICKCRFGLLSSCFCCTFGHELCADILWTYRYIYHIHIRHL